MSASRDNVSLRRISSRLSTLFTFFQTFVFTAREIHGAKRFLANLFLSNYLIFKRKVDNRDISLDLVVSKRNGSDATSVLRSTPISRPILYRSASRSVTPLTIYRTLDGNNFDKGYHFAIVAKELERFPLLPDRDRGFRGNDSRCALQPCVIRVPWTMNRRSGTDIRYSTSSFFRLNLLPKNGGKFISRLMNDQTYA